VRTVSLRLTLSSRPIAQRNPSRHVSDIRQDSKGHSDRQIYSHTTSQRPTRCSEPFSQTQLEQTRLLSKHSHVPSRYVSDVRPQEMGTSEEEKSLTAWALSSLWGEKEIPPGSAALLNEWTRYALRRGSTTPYAHLSIRAKQ
jgi:hypothetical protein